MDDVLSTTTRKGAAPLQELERKFNPCDLYSKGRERSDVKAILPFYEDLVSEFFPDKIDW